jgi:hypothetical protein
VGQTIVFCGLSESRRAATLDRRQKTIVCPTWFPARVSIGGDSPHSARIDQEALL